MKEFVNQKEAVNYFVEWMRRPKKNKALLFYGPPGVGKSALIEAYAKENNLDVVQMNASDFRSAKDINEVIGKSMVQQTLFKRGKIFFIDEVDGLFGRGDFGGAAELVNAIRESKHPIVLSANNPYNPKLKALRNYCTLIKFDKISVWDLEKRLRHICEDEGIEADDSVLKMLARMSNGDLRSAIMDLENISSGRKLITSKYLEDLGYRERERNVFDALKIIFKTRSVMAAKLALNDLDKDPEELLWWIENNVAREYERPEEVALAFEALSKADMFRQKIRARQNWKLLAYMIDMMTAGVAVSKKEMYRKFVKYQYPDNIIILGSSKQSRKSASELYKKLSEYFHCSSRKFKSQTLPYLRVMMSSRKFKADFMAGSGISSDELKILLG